MTRRAHRPFALVAIMASLVTILAAAAPPAGRADGAGAPTSLRQLTRDADTVVRARIVVAAASLDAGGVSYRLVHAEVLETLKGATAPGALAFATTGATTYVDGEEVLLFLQHVERVPELAATPLQSRLRYVAMPNGGEKVGITPGERAPFAAAVRGYAMVETFADPEMRTDALRKLTLEILKSGDPRLVASVMRDFSPGGDAAALTLADLPALVPLIESPRVPIGTRIAIVAELERRGLVFGPARWVRLLRTSRGSDLQSVIRAVGSHPSAGVTAQLVPLLEHADLAIATEAAVALGVPGNVEAVRPLVTCLGRVDAPLQHAALDESRSHRHAERPPSARARRRPASRHRGAPPRRDRGDHARPASRHDPRRDARLRRPRTRPRRRPGTPRPRRDALRNDSARAARGRARASRGMSHAA